MSDFDRNYAAARRSVGADRAVAIDQGLRAYMIRVYNYMAMGVALTGIASWLTFQAAAVTNANGAIVGLTSFGQIIFSGPAVLVLFLATLGLVFLISWRIDRLEPSTAFALFMVYAALLGVMLSSVLLAYTLTSITRVFFISAASFGALSLYGYTTKRDLSPIGSFLMMGLIGLIIAMVSQTAQHEGAIIPAVPRLLHDRYPHSSRRIARSRSNHPHLRSRSTTWHRIIRDRAARCARNGAPV